MLRGLLPAGTLTNLGLFGNGRAFEYLITKLAAHELPECRALATDMHRELALVIPAFVKRALDERYGLPAAERLAHVRESTARLAPRTGARESSPLVRLVEHDRRPNTRWSRRRFSRTPMLGGRSCVQTPARARSSARGSPPTAASDRREPWSTRSMRSRSSPTSRHIGISTAIAC